MAKENMKQLHERQIKEWSDLSTNQYAEIKGKGEQTPDMAAKFSIDHQVMRDKFKDEREQHPESKAVQEKQAQNYQAYENKINELKTQSPEQNKNVISQLQADQNERLARFHQINEFDPTKNLDKDFGYNKD